MEQKLISFEETEKLVNELSVDTSIKPDLCGLYKKARPILKFVIQPYQKNGGK